MKKLTNEQKHKSAEVARILQISVKKKEKNFGRIHLAIILNYTLQHKSMGRCNNQPNKMHKEAKYTH